MRARDPVFLLNSDADRTAFKRYWPRSQGRTLPAWEGAAVQQASQSPAPSLGASGSELKGWQDNCLQKRGEDLPKVTKVLPTPCTLIKGMRVKSGTWF